MALVLLLAGIYAVTLAPDITWANQGHDGGDLITASATGGVAHPPGYPTYLMLAKVVQLLPLGTLAYRTNLFSAVCAILASIVVANMMRRASVGRGDSQQDKTVHNWTGLLAGLGFGLSPLLWSQAVVSEVYALHALFTALVFQVGIFTPLKPESWNAWRDRVGGLVFGLGLGNHVTLAFLLPIWLPANLILKGEATACGDRKAFSRLNWGSLLRRLAWLLLGLCVYLTLPWRARSGSPVGWGDASTLEGFWWLVSARLYRGYLFSLSPGFLWSRFQAWAALLGNQLGLLGLVIALVGLFFGKAGSSRSRWISGYVFLVYSLFAIGYHAPDSYLLLLPAILSLALWFGTGVAALLDIADRSPMRRWLVPSGILLVLVLLSTNGVRNYPQVDASQDNRAVVFGETVLAEIPQNAILVTQADQDTFTLWYYHFALGKRPDVAVLNNGMLAFEWYRQQMQEIYPDLVLRAGDGCQACLPAELAADNKRPVCQTNWQGPEFLTCEDESTR
jgi:hypothetical protein